MGSMTRWASNSVLNRVGWAKKAFPVVKKVMKAKFPKIRKLSRAGKIEKAVEVGEVLK